jgi:hypothetical protein
MYVDRGADMIVLPSPPCQAKLEVHQSASNRNAGTKVAMPSRTWAT